MAARIAANSSRSRESVPRPAWSVTARSRCRFDRTWSSPADAAVVPAALLDAQLVRGCIRQNRQEVAIRSMIQQNFDALTNREKIHNLYGGGNVHAEMNSAVGRTLPTSPSIC